MSFEKKNGTVAAHMEDLFSHEQQLLLHSAMSYCTHLHATLL